MTSPVAQRTSVNAPEANALELVIHTYMPGHNLATQQNTTGHSPNTCETHAHIYTTEQNTHTHTHMKVHKKYTSVRCTELNGHTQEHMQMLVQLKLLKTQQSACSGTGCQIHI